MRDRHVFISPEAHDLMIYGDNSQSQVDYLQMQMQMMGSYMGDTQNRLMDIASNSYNYALNLVDNYDLMNELHQTGMVQMPNEFSVLNTLESIQNANPLMMRYIMAEPMVRAMWQNGELYGYGDNYNNFTAPMSTGVGNEDYDYRRVMDGMFVMDPGIEDTYYREHFHEALMEGDRQLTLAEKLCVMETWDNMRAMIADSDIDFTKPGGPAGNKKN